MTITTPVQQTPQAAPPPPRRKRRPIWVALAVLLIALGSLITWYIVGNLRDTHSVIAMRTDVPRGATITAQDLITVEITPDPALITIPSSQLASVVGRRAAVDLHLGGLISPASISDTVLPAPGAAVVGLVLDAGQIPETALKVGDRVRIISTPKDQDDPPTMAPSITLTATVVSSTRLPDATKTQVDVTVTAGDAPRLASLMATGRVALILDNNGKP